MVEGLNTEDTTLHGLYLSQERGPIWAYAKALRCSLASLLPPDATVGLHNGVKVDATVRTMQEAEALREIIRHLGQMLPSTRVMIAGDIGVGPERDSWADELAKIFGPIAPTTPKDEAND